MTCERLAERCSRRLTRSAARRAGRLSATRSVAVGPPIVAVRRRGVVAGQARDEGAEVDAWARSRAAASGPPGARCVCWTVVTVIAASRRSPFARPSVDGQARSCRRRDRRSGASSEGGGGQRAGRRDADRRRSRARRSGGRRRRPPPLTVAGQRVRRGPARRRRCVSAARRRGVDDGERSTRRGSIDVAGLVGARGRGRRARRAASVSGAQQGAAHAPYAPPSSEHSNVAPASSARDRERERTAVHGRRGAGDERVGAVASTVNVRVAGLGRSVFPAMSVARTVNVCRPSGSGPSVVGVVHGAKVRRRRASTRTSPRAVPPRTRTSAPGSVVRPSGPSRRCSSTARSCRRGIVETVVTLPASSVASSVNVRETLGECRVDLLGRPARQLVTVVWPVDSSAQT